MPSSQNVVVLFSLAGEPVCAISSKAMGNELMTGKSADGLASAGGNPIESKPLSAALKELLADPSSGAAIVAYLAVLKLLLHFYFNAFSYYGLLRDELYFIEAGKHLDWGYVDVGPLTMWMGRLSRELLGDSVFAVRFFPAIAGAVTIVVVGLLARELGGGRFAQGLSALVALIAPVWLGAQNMLSLAASEPVWWGLCAYFLIRIIKTGNTRLWVWFGVIAGIGLLNKPSMMFLGAAVTIGLLLTPQRKYLFNRWTLIGGLAALLIASPYILWQIPRGWPTVEFLAGMKRMVTEQIPSTVFLIGQVTYLHPLNFPIWLIGLGWFFCRERRPAIPGLRLGLRPHSGVPAGYQEQDLLLRPGLSDADRRGRGSD